MLNVILEMFYYTVLDEEFDKIDARNTDIESLKTIHVYATVIKGKIQT